MLLLQTTNRKWYTAYDSDDLSVLEGQPPIASVSTDIFGYCNKCAPVDKISTDMARRAVPLQ